MKTGIILLILLLVCVIPFSVLNPAYCETIYKINGEVIRAKISERTETAIWYEVLAGDIVEYVGINMSDIGKILNDDGSISEYSPIKAEVSDLVQKTKGTDTFSGVEEE